MKNVKNESERAEIIKQAHEIMKDALFEATELLFDNDLCDHESIIDVTVSPLIASCIAIVMDDSVDTPVGSQIFEVSNSGIFVTANTYLDGNIYPEFYDE